MPFVLAGPEGTEGWLPVPGVLGEIEARLAAACTLPGQFADLPAVVSVEESQLQVSAEAVSEDAVDSGHFVIDAACERQQERASFDVLAQESNYPATELATGM